jgi:hypothetical protein
MDRLRSVGGDVLAQLGDVLAQLGETRNHHTFQRWDICLRAELGAIAHDGAMPEQGVPPDDP